MQSTSMLSDLSKKSSVHLSPPHINYIWVGPPSEKSKNPVTRILQHDLSGPKQMANQNKSNPIVYWCLRQHHTYYTEKFRAEQNVKVACIEDFIQKIKETGNEFEEKAATTVLKDMDQLLYGFNRGSVRDFVTVKEIFSLFLLAIEGGYYLDTNVIPLTHAEVNLPSYENFQAPVLTNYDSYVVECWMMFAPKNNITIKNILTTYLNRWVDTENKFDTSNYFESYHKCMGNLIISTIQMYLSRPTVWELEGCLPLDEQPYKINMSALNLQKNYYNTHKKNSTGLLGWSIEYNDVTLLSDMINKGLDINFKIAGKTLLYHALEWGKEAAIDMLLSKGAFLTQKEKSTLLYELIKNNNLKMLKLTLHKLQIDVNYMVYHKSLLKHAIEQKNGKIVEYLNSEGGVIKQNSMVCCSLFKRNAHALENHIESKSNSFSFCAIS